MIKIFTVEDYRRRIESISARLELASTSKVTKKYLGELLGLLKNEVTTKLVVGFDDSVLRKVLIPAIADAFTKSLSYQTSSDEPKLPEDSSLSEMLQTIITKNISDNKNMFWVIFNMVPLLLNALPDDYPIKQKVVMAVETDYYHFDLVSEPNLVQ